MTARLLAATASDRPIMLLYDAEADHSGGETFLPWSCPESSHIPRWTYREKLLRDSGHNGPS